MVSCDIAIIGAGPYGLAAAAFLRQIPGLEVQVFGQPMEFWRNNMPKGMLLRSAWSASTIADPHKQLTLDAYKLFSGNHLCAPISLERFVDYGLWFQRQALPKVDQRKITLIERDRGFFRLTVEDGSDLLASRVVVAAGLSAFALRPPQFQGLPSALMSHTSEHRDLATFAGRRVAVIGAGQSALESAALLHESGADVEVITRRPQIHWLGWKQRLQCLGPLSRALFSPHDVGPAGISRIVAVPELLRRLPPAAQDTLRTISVRPAAAQWLSNRLRNVKITNQTKVTAAIPVGDRLHLSLDNGTSRLVDHALLGTGYRVDAARYSFLAPEILKSLQSSNGFPKLDRGFESSVPGLHFLGAPAAGAYGPVMYFVSGTKYAATSLLRFIAHNSRNVHA